MRAQERWQNGCLTVPEMARYAAINGAWMLPLLSVAFCHQSSIVISRGSLPAYF